MGYDSKNVVSLMGSIFVFMLLIFIRGIALVLHKVFKLGIPSGRFNESISTYVD